jgi:hypothetical protein
MTTTARVSNTSSIATKDGEMATVTSVRIAVTGATIVDPRDAGRNGATIAACGYVVDRPTADALLRRH